MVQWIYYGQFLLCCCYDVYRNPFGSCWKKKMSPPPPTHPPVSANKHKTHLHATST